MFYRYDVKFGGDYIGTCYTYNKAIKLANEMLDVLKNNPVDDDDYRLLAIDRFSIFGDYVLIIWSEVEQKYIKCKKRKNA